MKKIFPLIFTITIFSLFFLNCFDKNSSTDDNLFSSIDPIEITIEPDYNTAIRFSIANTMDEDISFYVHDTPILGFGKELFDVSSNGDSVQYMGRLVMRVEKDDDFIELKSGEKKEFSVDLSDAYHFTAIDDYDIQFKSIISYRNNESLFDRSSALSGVKISNAESNKIRLQVVMPVFRSAYASPVFNSCNAAKRDVISNSSEEAIKAVDATRSYLNSCSGNDLFEDWYGSYTSSRFNFVKNAYKKIDDAFQEDWIYNCPTADCENTYAYVYKSLPYEVWLCPDWFNSSSKAASYKDKGMVLIHEASHWNATIGADDHVYHYEACKTLAENTPNKAIKNADQYHYFPLYASNQTTCNKASIELTKKVYNKGENIVVKYYDLYGDPEDWIALSINGAAKESYETYKYVDKNSPVNGTLTFSGFNAERKYEARLYFHDSYNIEQKIEFEVSASGGSNEPPSVSFGSPVNGSTAGSDLGVVVNASDSDGSIDRVELFINNSHVRNEGGDPYEWGTANGNQSDSALLNLSPGNYQLRADAYDDEGSKSSAVISVTVQDGGTSPYAEVTSPADGSVFKTGSFILIRADAFDPDGINVVRFWVNDGTANEVIFEDNDEPYQYSWEPPAAGTYKIWIKYRDVNSDSLTSSKITIRVEADINTITDKLLPGEFLVPSQRIQSSNGQYKLYFQGDGNLVLRDNSGSALWSTGTHNKGGNKFILQGDSNLVIYSESSGALWSSKTVGENATELKLNDDGSLVLYSGSSVVWSVP